MDGSVISDRLVVVGGDSIVDLLGLVYRGLILVEMMVTYDVSKWYKKTDGR